MIGPIIWWASNNRLRALLYRRIGHYWHRMAQTILTLASFAHERLTLTKLSKSAIWIHDFSLFPSSCGSAHLSLSSEAFEASSSFSDVWTSRVSVCSKSSSSVLTFLVNVATALSAYTHKNVRSMLTDYKCCDLSKELEVFGAGRVEQKSVVIVNDWLYSLITAQLDDSNGLNQCWRRV